MSKFVAKLYVKRKNVSVLTNATKPGALAERSMAAPALLPPRDMAFRDLECGSNQIIEMNAQCLGND